MTVLSPASVALAAFMLAALPGAPGARIIVDRREAIASTIAEAKPSDVILLAGKGHEGYQEIAGAFHPFSDLAEAELALIAYGRAAA